MALIVLDYVDFDIYGILLFCQFALIQIYQQLRSRIYFNFSSFWNLQLVPPALKMSIFVSDEEYMHCSLALESNEAFALDGYQWWKIDTFWCSQINGLNIISWPRPSIKSTQANRNPFEKKRLVFSMCLCHWTLIQDNSTWLNNLVMNATLERCLRVCVEWSQNYVRFLEQEQSARVSDACSYSN